MRFLDLDLDFFLDKKALFSGSDSGRLSSGYKPWSVSKVRHFLEYRCSLSHDTPVPGRTVEDHDRVIDFWSMLIKSDGLKVPFEVIHIDAHPDITVRGGLYLKSGLLCIDSTLEIAVLNREQVHSGNYLTFAIASGWIASLVWVPIHKTFRDLPKGYIDATHGLVRLKKVEVDSPLRDLSVQRERCVPYKVVPWYQFRTSETFDYMALSRSPNFTTPESDALVPVIEEYMGQI